jgi:hypothetical protein
MTSLASFTKAEGEIPVSAPESLRYEQRHNF